MKTFFGSTYIKKEELEEAGIKHPIKLEYYKIINEDEFINKKNAKYGINVIKTEYIKDNAKIEEKSIKYLTNNEQKVENILNILKDNEVTPISIQDIICDYIKNPFLYD